MKIDGSVALVTGAGRGLGLAFARKLVSRGAARMYAAARDPAAVTEPGVVLAANGGGVVVNMLSVTSFFNNPLDASYGASKSAEWSLANGIRLDSTGLSFITFLTQVSSRSPCDDARP